MNFLRLIMVLHYVLLLVIEVVVYCGFISPPQLVLVLLEFVVVSLRLLAFFLHPNLSLFSSNSWCSV